MELNINANITFQRNKLLSLSGMYNGEMLSAPEYKSLSGLDGAGFHGGYNHIVYQMVGQPLGVFYLPHSTGLESDGNGGYTYGIADLNGGGVSLEDGEDRYVAGQAVPKTILGSTSVSATSVSICLCRLTELSDIKFTTEPPDLYEHEYISRL